MDGWNTIVSFLGKRPICRAFAVSFRECNYYWRYNHFSLNHDYGRKGSHLANGPWKKLWTLFSLLNMESPKVQKVSHWLSKGFFWTSKKAILQYDPIWWSKKNTWRLDFTLLICCKKYFTGAFFFVLHLQRLPWTPLNPNIFQTASAVWK